MSARPHLVFVHGWGFGPGFWRPLRRCLADWQTHTLDLGFYGRPRLEINVDQPWVAIGHSTGFLWILKQFSTKAIQDLTRFPCLGVVSLMGFSRFVRGDDFPHGVDARILQKMGRDLLRDPDQVLNEFMALGGVDIPMSSVRAEGDNQALATGLQWLATWDERATFQGLNRPWLALAQRDDGIVTEKMTLDCFGNLPAVASGGLQWFAEGGHFLPLVNRPKPFATAIATFLDTHFS